MCLLINLRVWKRDVLLLLMVIIKILFEEVVLNFRLKVFIGLFF